MEEILIKIREFYGKSAEDEKILREMEALIQAQIHNASPVLKAYRASILMIKARFTLSPFQKYAFFLEGKKALQEILESHPEEIEIRFIRISIQKNLPVFLGYNHLDSDKAWLEKNKDAITSPELKRVIDAFWKQEGWGNF